MIFIFLVVSFYKGKPVSKIFTMARISKWWSLSSSVRSFFWYSIRISCMSMEVSDLRELEWSPSLRYETINAFCSESIWWSSRSASLSQAVFIYSRRTIFVCWLKRTDSSRSPLSSESLGVWTSPVVINITLHEICDTPVRVAYLIGKCKKSLKSPFQLD